MCTVYINLYATWLSHDLIQFSVRWPAFNFKCKVFFPMSKTFVNLIK